MEGDSSDNLGNSNPPFMFRSGPYHSVTTGQHIYAIRTKVELDNTTYWEVISGSVVAVSKAPPGESLYEYPQSLTVDLLTYDSEEVVKVNISRVFYSHDAAVIEADIMNAFHATIPCNQVVS